MTLVQFSYGLRQSNHGGILFFTRISAIPHPRVPISQVMYSCYASKQNFRWNCSGASGTASWELMQRITSRNTRGYCYLRLWHGIIGATVRASRPKARGLAHYFPGVPIAWMLSSNGTQITIQYFMNLVRSRSPDVSPSIFMTDRDQAQVNAICETYPTCRIFYCWWHVLRAIRSHFVTTEFQELWALIQKWVRTTDQYEFDAWWEDIQNDHTVPQSLSKYLAREWLPVKEMWSAVFRQNRTIFEEGDTNMLLEAYVLSILVD